MKEVIIVGLSEMNIITAVKLRAKNIKVKILPAPGVEKFTTDELKPGQLLGKLDQCRLIGKQLGQSLPTSESWKNKDLKTVLTDFAKSKGVVILPEQYDKIKGEHIEIKDSSNKIKKFNVKDCLVLDGTGKERLVISDLNATLKNPHFIEKGFKNNYLNTHSHLNLYSTPAKIKDLCEVIGQDKEVDRMEEVAFLELLRRLGWPEFCFPKAKLLSQQGVLSISYETTPNKSPEAQEMFLKLLLAYASGMNLENFIKKESHITTFVDEPSFIPTVAFQGKSNLPTVIPIHEARFKGDYRIEAFEDWMMLEADLLKSIKTQKDGTFSLDFDQYEEVTKKRLNDYENDLIRYYGDVLGSILKAPAEMLPSYHQAKTHRSFTPEERIQINQAINEMSISTQFNSDLISDSHQLMRIKEPTVLENGNIGEAPILTAMAKKLMDIYPKVPLSRYAERDLIESQLIAVGDMLSRLADEATDKRASRTALLNLYRSSLEIYYFIRPDASFNIKFHTLEKIRNLLIMDGKYDEIAKLLKTYDNPGWSDPEIKNFQNKIYFLEVADLVTKLEEDIEKKVFSPKYLKNRYNNLIMALEKITEDVINNSDKVQMHIKLIAIQNALGLPLSDVKLLRVNFSSSTSTSVPSKSNTQKGKSKLEGTGGKEKRSNVAAKKPKNKGNKNTSDDNSAKNKKDYVPDLTTEKNYLTKNLSMLKESINEKINKINTFKSLYQEQVKASAQLAEQCKQVTDKDNNASNAARTVKLANMVMDSINQRGEKLNKYVNDLMQELSILQNQISNLNVILQSEDVDATKTADVKKSLNILTEAVQKSTKDLNNTEDMLTRMVTAINDLGERLSTTAFEENVRFVPTTSILTDNNSASSVTTAATSAEPVPVVSKPEPAKKARGGKKGAAKAATTPAASPPVTEKVDNKNVNIEVVRVSNQSAAQYVTGRNLSFFPTEKKGERLYKESHHIPMPPEKIVKHLQEQLWALSVRIQDQSSYKEDLPTESIIFHRALCYNISKMFVVLWELDHRLHGEPTDLNSAYFKNWRNKFAHLTDALSVAELKELATDIRTNYINPLLEKKISTLDPESLLKLFPSTDKLKETYKNLHEQSQARDYNPRSFTDILKTFEQSLAEFKKVGKILANEGPHMYHNHPDIKEAMKMLLAQMGDCLQELEARQSEDEGATWSHIKEQNKDDLISNIIIARNKVFHNVQRDVHVDILSKLNKQAKDWEVKVHMSPLESKRIAPGRSPNK